VPRLITAATLTFLAAGVVAVSAGAASEPILAGPWSPNQEGYGQLKPGRIFNGGDPTGLVTDIHWLTWGRSQAIGTGMAEWVGPHQEVAGGTPQPARIVLFQLGSCKRRRAYDAIEWYFQQHGQHFDPHRYINACTGTYYPRA